MSQNFCPTPNTKTSRVNGPTQKLISTKTVFPKSSKSITWPWERKRVPPSEHPNPHSKRLKWVVHLPQNGTIGFDPQPTHRVRTRQNQSLPANSGSASCRPLSRLGWPRITSSSSGKSFCGIGSRLRARRVGGEGASNNMEPGAELILEEDGLVAAPKPSSELEDGRRKQQT